MKILIDDREGSRIKYAQKYYKNHQCYKAHLKSGDFIFDDKVCFEYKTTHDFIYSVKSGRVFRQANRQAENYLYNFIIVETDEQQLHRHSVISGIPYKKLYSLFYSAISSLNTITRVLTAPYRVDCFYLMEKQAEKCIENKSLSKVNWKKKPNTAETYLSCINGIGEVKAHQICEDLNIKRLSDLLEVTRTDLTALKGVGDKTALKIMDSI